MLQSRAMLSQQPRQGTPKQTLRGQVHRHCLVSIRHHLNVSSPSVQKEQCPEWGQDFNCIDTNRAEDRKPKLIAREYRKIFRPHECDLPEWDAVGLGK